VSRASRPRVPQVSCLRFKRTRQEASVGYILPVENILITIRGQGALGTGGRDARETSGKIHVTQPNFRLESTGLRLYFIPSWTRSSGNLS
jgi:hypothetical protein